MKKLLISLTILLASLNIFSQTSELKGTTYTEGLVIGEEDRWSSLTQVDSMNVVDDMLVFYVGAIPHTIGGYSRISTASDSIDIADRGGKIYMNVGTANNLTVVANSIKALPVDTEITIINWGAGQTTIVAGAGVTINSADASMDLRAQYSAATLIKQATDVWLLVGDID